MFSLISSELRLQVKIELFLLADLWSGCKLSCDWSLLNYWVC